MAKWNDRDVAGVVILVFFLAIIGGAVWIGPVYKEQTELCKKECADVRYGEHLCERICK